MQGTQAFDDLVGLKIFLEHQIKNLNNEIYPLHNSVFNYGIKKKIRFLKCILKLLKSNDFSYQELVEMVDIKTDKYKNLDLLIKSSV